MWNRSRGVVDSSTMTGSTHVQYERDKLSRLLRELRVQMGFAGRQAAQRAGFSQSKLSKIETGLLLPSFADAEALCAALQATAEQRDAVLDLLKDLHGEMESAQVILRRGAYRKQQQIQRVEQETQLLRAFDLGAVIGLLQTSNYMRSVFARRLSAADREQAVAARLERQRVLDDTAREFIFVMTEGALRWRAGTSQAMAAQLDHISTISQQSNVGVGIIAWTTQVHVFPAHEFHVYDERMVIVGLETATASIGDPRDVAVYTQLFSELEALADFDDAARVTLASIAADYRALDT